MTTFSGQSALVTGGGSGIGLACARALLVDGASVTIAGRSASRLAGAAEELRAVAPDGAVVATAECDVANEDDVAAAVATAAAAGPLTVCVAAAGTGTFGPITDMPAEQWDQVLAVNLTGAFFTVKHAARAMAGGGRGGSIVALSSIAAPLTHRWMSAYCVSKAGLEALVRNAADELGRKQIRVNAVRPSLVPTELAAGLDNDPQVRQDYLDCMPISRTGTPEDVANAVRYLAGPESSWVTGQCLGTDGGHTLRRGPDLDHWAGMMFPDAVATVD